MQPNAVFHGNRTRLGTALLAGLLVPALLTLPAAVAQTGDPDRVEKRSNSSFKDTLKNLETTLKAEHMMIVAKIDHKNMLSMVGAKIGGATTVEFGKPDMGKMLLPMNPAIGLDMPLKIYVYETPDGKVSVAYRKVSPQFSSYGSPEVAKAGEMMDMMLDKFAAAAAQ